jgi:hypothetical protein
MKVSKPGLVGESVQHPVDEIHELVAKDGERLVPLPIPMAVGKKDGTHLHISTPSP